MEFEFTDQQEEFRREFREWLDDNIPELWLENNRKLPEDSAERERFLRDWQATLDEGGWAGIHWPEEYGGRGASLWEQVIYEREVAHVNPPPQINTIGINLLGPTLIEVGTEEQKEQFIPKILNGEHLWCQGYSEPGSGSDVASLTTEATVEDDRLLINGQKIWTSYAHMADWCMLMVRTDSSGTKHEGITALMLELDGEGIENEQIHQIDDEWNFNQVFFDDAVAKRENVIGEVDNGWEVMKIISAFEHAGTRVFEIERRLEELREYCASNTRNGKLLIEKQSVKRKLADFETRVDGAKLAHYRNIARQEEEGVPGPEGSLDFAVSKDLRNDFEEFAVSLLGPGAGLWEDGQADGRWIDDFLYSYGIWIAGGTGDIQRNIIGESVLDLPKDPKSKTSHRWS